MGESDQDFFIFDERSERVRSFPNERGMQRALARLDAGKPISTWLTAADGWQEASLPEMFWRPCKSAASRQGGAPAWPSRQQCEEALAPQKIDLYRKTTWGRRCARLRRGGERSGGQEMLFEFCSDLGL